MNTLLVLGAVLTTPAGVAGPVVVKQQTPEQPPRCKRVYLAGVEHTEASFRNGTEALATGTHASGDFPRTQQNMEASRLRVVGLSQAGPIVSIVARQSSDPAIDGSKLVGKAAQAAPGRTSVSGRALSRLGTSPLIMPLGPSERTWSITRVAA